jgi:Domain of unknown function (DUF1707)
VTEDDPGGEIEVRASDAEREATVVRLRDSAGEGRLSLEELAERVEAADGALTRADLASLVSDLPVQSTRAQPAAQGRAARGRPRAAAGRTRGAGALDQHHGWNRHQARVATSVALALEAQGARAVDQLARWAEPRLRVRLLREGEHLVGLDPEDGRLVLAAVPEHAVTDLELPRAAVLGDVRLGDSL